MRPSVFSKSMSELSQSMISNVSARSFISRVGETSRGISSMMRRRPPRRGFHLVQRDPLLTATTPFLHAARDLLSLTRVRPRRIQKRLGFEFVQPLVADMIERDPEKRPKIDEVVSRFAEIRKSLRTRKLRSRIVRRQEIGIVRFFRACGYLYRTTGYILTKKAPIPKP
ncbi:hypothetical protein FA95DRAFT_710344 [Auriscalpium vulgare]|uniref:Uncharacterized protein n=1 Tax=Auriscalpium vulgare TaxID=40419 RepID=A0ACB8RB01_9AGAM|nr:hypothetical protein FA95DRAFT_710344 [Auriscalpium vulgare]